jgi:phosphoglycolate phosphatase
MVKPIAVLFDIDETLVHTGGAGARSWAWAFDQLHGVPADIGKHTSAGETDPQVGRGTFRAVLGRDPSYDEMARLYAKYLWRLSEEIWTSQAYRVLDGAEDLLQRLTDAGIILGVVSGAMEGAARTKMEPGKLNRYFIFGSYGSDSPDRTEVTRLGIAKAARLHGQDFSPEQVYVVGDTPRDVAAGRAAGATAIGVASGNYGVDELRAAQADHVLRSLTEPFPGL